MLGTLVACAVGEKPPANAPAHSLAPMSLATAPPEPPPTSVAPATPTPPPPCHRTAFSQPTTQEETDDALARLAKLEARAKATFDVGAGKPVIQGSGDEVLGGSDEKGRYHGVLPSLEQEAAKLDDALRTVRPTPAIAARALLVVGAIYDAMAAGLVVWAGTKFSLFSPPRLAELNRMRNSGNPDLIALANDIVAMATKTIPQQRLSKIDAARANALSAYLGALELLLMSPTAEVATLRTRATSRVQALLPAVAGPRLATRTLQDPSSDSPSCLLEFVDPTR